MSQAQLDYGQLLALSRLQAAKLQLARKQDRRIRLVKLTRKQATILAECLIYFMKLHERALRKAKRFEGRPDPMSLLDDSTGRKRISAALNYIEPIPLLKFYKMYRCNTKDRQAVQVAANAYFKPVFRGNFKTGKCSGWEPRAQPQFNPMVKKMLLELFQQNEEHINSVSTYINTKGSEIENVTVTTTFKFESQQQAKDFATLMSQVSFEADDVRARAPKIIRRKDVNRVLTPKNAGTVATWEGDDELQT